jgi:hypothetical protein
MASRDDVWTEPCCGCSRNNSSEVTPGLVLVCRASANPALAPVVQATMAATTIAILTGKDNEAVVAVVAASVVAPVTTDAAAFWAAAIASCFISACLEGRRVV